MSYSILMLKPRLYYIKWWEIPKPNSKVLENLFFELNAILDSEEEGAYVLSDLRAGRLTNVRHLQRLVKVLDHPHYLGGTSFSTDQSAQFDAKMLSYIRAQMLQNRARNATAVGQNVRDIFDQPEEAISYLEDLEEGLTQDINWEEVLNGTIFSH